MNTYIKRVFIFFSILILSQGLRSQTLSPPIPVEIFLGHQSIYSQTVIKKRLKQGSKLSFFGLATFTADYNTETIENNSLTIINQLSYQFGKGFGVMIGTDINSNAGFSPIIGPQYNYSSSEFLAVTVLSIFLNSDIDVRILGLYEYKPKITDVLTLYTRLQFLYNQNSVQGTHNRSYLYLRAGIKKNSLIIGLAANLDQRGPNNIFQDNYGVFVRYELR